MIALLKTPWGRFPLPLPGGAQAVFHFRVAGPCAAGAAAPGEASSSLPCSGAARFTDEGDLVAVPAFVRSAAGRFVSARVRVAGREGGEALPPPQGPP